MRPWHTKASILILLGLVSGLSGIVGNIASGILPKAWQPYLWLSWPIFFLLVIIGIVLGVWQLYTERNTIFDQSPFQNKSTRQEISAGDTMQTPKGTGNDFSIQELQKRLQEHCSLSDLKDLCFAMGIDYDNYPRHKSDFIRDLLLDLSRKHQIDVFIETVRSEKPWVL